MGKGVRLCQRFGGLKNKSSREKKWERDEGSGNFRYSSSAVSLEILNLAIVDILIFPLACVAFQKPQDGGQVAVTAPSLQLDHVTGGLSATPGKIIRSKQEGTSSPSFRTRSQTLQLIFMVPVYQRKNICLCSLFVLSQLTGKIEVHCNCDAQEKNTFKKLILFNSSLVVLLDEESVPFQSTIM